jgi:hypothetical protein
MAQSRSDDPGADGPDRTRGDRTLWRKLTILAQDPNVTCKGQPIWSTVELPCEPLEPGPCGARIKVVDYDATQDRFYHPLPKGKYECNGEPVDPFVKASTRERLGNPNFHQQNAYAIAMRILSRFETALGRRVNFGFHGHQLHIAPHAFAEANAYYSRDSRSLCFGYFPGDDGQLVFTCLSHDVVAHETTHALLDGLRPRYIDPSSPDQAGFHEGFSDIVALLSVLSDARIVEAALASEDVMAEGRKLIARKHLRPDSLKKSVLLGLAKSMGDKGPGGSIKALRQSAELKPDPALLETDVEFSKPHRRGEILVAAILNAFIKVWTDRILGLGEIRKGYLDAKRVIDAGATSASHLLTISIRALDYAPPTDLHFGDYLSALLTADRETVPDDSYGYRSILRECFAAWGIKPSSAPDGDGCWLPFGEPIDYGNIRFDSLQRDPDEAFRFIWQNARALNLAGDAYTQVTGVRPIARVAPDGLVVRETVVDFIQILALRSDELARLGLSKPPEMPEFREVRLYGGAVLVLDEYGRLKFSIGNDVRNVERQQRRLDHLARSGFFDYPSEAAFSRGFFSRLHLDRARAL